MSMREVDVYGMAYQAAGIDVQEPDVIYSGSGYCITRDEDGHIWFEDNNNRDELARAPKNPEYIKWDESRGWIYKNGRDLPWKEAE